MYRNVYVESSSLIMAFPVTPTDGELHTNPLGTQYRYTAVDGKWSITGTRFFPEGPTRATVGGIPIGTDLGTSPLSTYEVLLEMLYPYLAPGAALSGGDTREFGSSTSVTLAWTATRNDQAITGIDVNGTAETPTGNTQTGATEEYATQDVNTGFMLTVTDGVTPVYANTAVYWQSKIYWGKYNSTCAPSDGDILALSGAGVGTGNELAAGYAKSYNGINGAGQRLMFAWPTAYGTTPTFLVNGLPNTAFTKIRSNSSFVNANGYARNYDVWYSDTVYNSPVTLFSIQ